MKIIGFNLSAISVERDEKPKDKIEIKQNIHINNISKDSVYISKDEILKIDFAFTVKYEPDFAKVEFKGHLLILPEKDELKKVIKDWKDKKISDEIKNPMFNYIMGKCNIKALSLEDELGLPLHIPMPKLSNKKE